MKKIRSLPLIILIVGVWIALYVMGTKGYYPFELIPGNAFDYSIIAMMILFGLACLILDKNLFQPLMTIMETRESKIREADKQLVEAEKSYEENMQAWENKLITLRREYQQKKDALVASLTAEKDEKLTSLKKELQVEYEDALKNLAKEKEEAKSMLEKEIADLARVLAEAVLGRKIA